MLKQNEYTHDHRMGMCGYVMYIEQACATE